VWQSTQRVFCVTVEKAPRRRPMSAPVGRADRSRAPDIWDHVSTLTHDQCLSHFTQNSFRVFQTGNVNVKEAVFGNLVLKII